MPTNPRKILIIRFSSIGDIVLTTPVIRNIKKSWPEAEVHYLTRKSYHPVLAENPYIDHFHFLEDSLGKTIRSLRRERYDLIIDLHKNLRSFRVRFALGGKSISFDKANWGKYLMVRAKGLPKAVPHIVERYHKVLQNLGIEPDDDGLDIFFHPNDRKEAGEILGKMGPDFQPPGLAVILGATHRTKRWMPEYFAETLNRYGKPVILLGGNDIRGEADELIAGLQIPFVDAVGKYNLMVSSLLMSACEAVLTHDTGLMHIAAAMKMNIFSLWGSTVPELGMTPWKAGQSILIENREVSCRPCSKIGFNACPKGHFKCMKNLRPEEVLKRLNQ